MYYVEAGNGQSFGPADFATLQQWVREGRVGPQTILRDMQGQKMMASTLPGLFGGSVPPPRSSEIPGHAPYMRAGYGLGLDDGSNDITTGWILIGVSFVAFGPLLSGFAIVQGNKAIAKGNPKGYTLKNWAIGITILHVALTILGIIFWTAIMASFGLH